MRPNGDLDQEFKRYLGQPVEKWGLAEGALLIAQQEYPSLDKEKYLSRLNEMGIEASKCLALCASPSEKISALNGYFFGDRGFRGARDDYYDPRNSYLSDVLDRRVGIPITLSCLYLEMAWRSAFGLLGVQFPGHFLVAWKDSPPDFRKDSYIDVFNGGGILGEKGLQDLLDRNPTGVKLDPLRHLKNAGVREILHRILGNLKSIHASGGNMERALWAAEWMILLKSDDHSSLRDKGMLLFALKRMEAAEAALLAYLDKTGMPPDYAAVWRTLYSIRAGNPLNMN